MSAPTNKALRIATVIAVSSLLMIGSVVLPWVMVQGSTNVDGVGIHTSKTYVVTGFSAPIGMGGMLVAGLGVLAAISAGVVVFTRGRGAGLSAARWLAYAGISGALGLYFLIKAWRFDGFESTASEQVIVWTRTQIRYGLVAGLVFAATTALFGLGGAYWSWRQSGVSKQRISA